jgi:molybdopterin-guanine dinucleotide biosynthesis protein B
MKVVAFAGFSGSGKTTLVEQLIPALKLRGLRVSVVKHAHHKFDVDHPGKDTWRHREAGAFEVVAASRHRMVLMREFEQPCDLRKVCKTSAAEPRYETVKA